MPKRRRFWWRKESPFPWDNPLGCIELILIVLAPAVWFVLLKLLGG